MRVSDWNNNVCCFRTFLIFLRLFFRIHWRSLSTFVRLDHRQSWSELHQILSDGMKSIVFNIDFRLYTFIVMVRILYLYYLTSIDFHIVVTPLIQGRQHDFQSGGPKHNLFLDDMIFLLKHWYLEKQFLTLFHLWSLKVYTKSCFHKLTARSGWLNSPLSAVHRG